MTASRPTLQKSSRLGCGSTYGRAASRERESHHSAAISARASCSCRLLSDCSGGLGVDPTHGRETHRCLRSQCRSAGRRCFAAVHPCDAHERLGSDSDTSSCSSKGARTCVARALPLFSTVSRGSGAGGETSNFAELEESCEGSVRESGEPRVEDRVERAPELELEAGEPQTTHMSHNQWMGWRLWCRIAGERHK